MRGNWLYYRGQFNAFPFRVENVTKRKVGYHTKPGESRMQYLRLNEEVQPIPLDARQLEKNGWKLNGDDAMKEVWKIPCLKQTEWNDRILMMI